MKKIRRRKKRRKGRQKILIGYEDGGDSDTNSDNDSESEWLHSIYDFTGRIQIPRLEDFNKEEIYFMTSMFAFGSVLLAIYLYYSSNNCVSSPRFWSNDRIIHFSFYVYAL